MWSRVVLNGSQDFFHTFSMALYQKWDVKNDLAYVLQFFSRISDSLGSVTSYPVHCMYSQCLFSCPFIIEFEPSEGTIDIFPKYLEGERVRKLQFE